MRVQPFGPYLVASIITLGTIELYRKRRELNTLSSCWQGMDALWKGRG